MVGFWVGSCVGFTEGLTVGGEVGSLVGDEVGIDVGTDVGSLVGSVSAYEIRCDLDTDTDCRYQKLGYVLDRYSALLLGYLLDSRWVTV